MEKQSTGIVTRSKSMQLAEERGNRTVERADSLRCCGDSARVGGEVAPGKNENVFLLKRTGR